MNTKAIIEKQKELIEYQNIYVVMTSLDSVNKLLKLRSELAVLEAEEELIKTTIKPTNLYPEPTAIEVKRDELSQVEAKEVKSAERETLIDFCKWMKWTGEYEIVVDLFLNQFKPK